MGEYFINLVLYIADSFIFTLSILDECSKNHINFISGNLICGCNFPVNCDPSSGKSVNPIESNGTNPTNFSILFVEFR